MSQPAYDDGWEWEQTTCMECDAPLGAHYYEMLASGDAWCLCRKHRPLLDAAADVSDAIGDYQQGFYRGSDFVEAGAYVRVYEMRTDKATIPSWARV